MNNPEIPPPLRDFRNFLYVVWKHLGLPEPTPVQYDIAYYLQYGPRRSVIEAFRGVGKSWITVSYVLWRLMMNPQLKVMVVSGSKAQADNFSTFCLQLINSIPILAHLKPGKDQRDSKVQFDVGPSIESKDPSVKSVGITGQITGSRADLIIPDDIESLNNSLTQTARDRLSEAIKEFDAVIKPGGEIKYLGTPQTEQSIYNALPSRGYEIRIWPSRFPDEKLLTRYGSKLAPFIAEAIAKGGIVGSSTDPRRFSDLDLAEREASYGRSGFALQFQLDTSLSDTLRYPLKLSDLIVMNVNSSVAPEQVVWASDPALAWTDDVPCVGFSGERYYRPMRVQGDYIPYQGSVLAIDPKGRGADELGYAVANQLNGYIHVPEAGGRQGGYNPESLEWLAQCAKRNNVKKVVVEANFGDGMFTELLRPVLARIHPCDIEEVKHSIQKERRICDTLEPVMSSHRLIIDPKVIRQDYESVQNYGTELRSAYMLFYQLSRITRDRGALRHDDRIDALAMAVGHWSKIMAQDDEKRVAQRKQELLQKDIDQFMRNALGRPQVRRNWIR